MLSSQIDFSKIVFSDESRFCLGPDNSWVHVKRGCWNQSVMKEKKKIEQGAMFFEAISSCLKSTLVRCSTGVNSQEYLKNLEDSGIIESMNQRYGFKKWFFMQDGAPAHKSSKSVNILETKLLILPGWPPNSPDLNPIEIIWSVIKRTLQKQKITIDLLESKVCEIWNNIPMNVITKLVNSFRSRLELCLKIGENQLVNIYHHTKINQMRMTLLI